MPFEVVYDLHGVTAAVEVDEALRPAVVTAIDRRLCAFRSETAGAADLRILVGGATLAPPPGPGRPVYDSATGPVHYHDEAGVLWADHRNGAQLRCHGAAGVAHLACRADDPASVWLATHPLLTLALIELLKHRGRYNLHAACVAAGERGILVAGPSGAGKTTLALALVRAGLRFLADDMVWLQAPAGEAVEILGFADEVDVTEHTLSMFAELVPVARRQPTTWGKTGGKWSLRLEEVHHRPFGRRCRPALLLLAQLGSDATSRWTPLRGVTTLVELAPNVLLTDARHADAHLAALAQLAETTPTARLELGRDLDALAPRLVAEFDRDV